MATTTNIEWTEKTWNPTTGCDRISPGCDNCYALTMARRLKGMGQAKYQRDGHPVTSGPGFARPPTWTPSQSRCGGPSPAASLLTMSDLFHARVPVAFLAQVFAVMAATPQHTYQIPTKRPERAARILSSPDFRDTVLGNDTTRPAPDWPLHNLWLGTSMESSDYTHRADALRRTPAAMRFISAEPLLGPLAGLDLHGIDWLIIGGESGAGARPLELQWIADLIRSARRAGAVPFVKQLGSVWARNTNVEGNTVHALGDTKGGNPDYWPAHLHIREHPSNLTSATEHRSPHHGNH